jgi:carbamoyltransferase
MLILGLNTFHADAAAALVDVESGRLLAAVAEERLNRVKHFSGFPALAVAECLRIAGAKADDIGHVAIARDGRANLLAKIGFAARNLARLPTLARQRLANRAAVASAPDLLARALGRPDSARRPTVHNVEHHLAHLASAFLVSPFEKAALMSLDGFGDFASRMTGLGEGTRIRVFDRTLFPHSLGVLYTAACQYIGFDGYGDEGKVMGLAPYGRDEFREWFDDIARPVAGGGFALNLDAFVHHVRGVDYHADEAGRPMVAPLYSDRWVKRLGPARKAGEELAQRHMDVARSLQECLERLYMHLLNDLHRRTGVDTLCLAGGVALNGVANGKALEQTPFRRIYVQPAAGDDGTAVGAAYWTLNAALGRPRAPAMDHAYTGASWSDDEVAAALSARGVPSERLEGAALYDRTAEAIAAGRVVGWFQGAMEWGPRALGNRSIVAHPGLPGMRDTLNARIKRREWFRPFAPSILEERLAEWFESDHPSPFMLMVYRTRPDRRAALCAVNHVDDTGRVQTVNRRANPRYHDLISAFERRTGLPVVLNTSFNENEPVVNTPAEAIDCYLRTRMDALTIGDRHCRRD